MKKTLTILIGIALFSCCVQEELSWTLGDIYGRPELYCGKNIVVEGEYRGWEVNCAPTGPPVTRNDWQIRDETGCIYVTAFFPELDPYADVETSVRINGVVQVNNLGVPYIAASDVVILEDVGVNETNDIGDIFSEPEEEIAPPSLPF